MINRKKVWAADIFRRTAALILASVMISGGCVEVFAADSTVIEKVTVSFKSSYGEQEEMLEPEIKVSGSDVSMGDIQFRTDYDNWKPGKKVRVEITVNAENGKVFPVSLNRSGCKVSGAEFVSAKALDDTTLQVKVDYKPVMKLGDTEKAGWSSSSSRRATWKSVEHAPGYTVTLYGNDKVVKRMNVSTNSVNLAEYMDDVDKTYYYEVKAVPLTSDEKKYLKEGNYVTSTDQEFDWEDEENWNSNSGRSGGSGSSKGPGGSSSAGDGGSFKGDSYVMPDGAKAINTWKKVAGNWYFFDGNGNRTRGWMTVGGRRYFMDGNGVMCTGWIGGNGGPWYYMGPDGDMQTGWIQPNPEGWYYLNQDGVMVQGWVNVDGNLYYLGQDGRMLTGWNIIDGKWYYFNTYSDGTKGALYVNRRTPDGYYVDGSGVWNP